MEFPSGKAYKGQNHLLSETGVYTVTYSATINGNEYSFSQNFTVRQSAYTVDMNSKAAYGTNNYISGEKGLNVTLSPKGEFIYNQILDLSENTKEDRLLRLFLTPSVTGEREADGVEIVITDLYNPENYITVRTTYNNGLDIQSYVKAAAAGRTLSGYSMTPENGTYFVGGDFGRHIWLSVNGTVRDGQKQLDAFEIYYDYSEKQIHVGANTCHGNWDQRMVCDLDDPACFADTWDGFTTGEVIISLRAYNCVSENFNFFLTEVNGKKVETDYAVFNAPKISVNTLGMDETDLPLAVVGKSYPVYSAEAYDATIGKLDVSVKAIYAYGSANEIILDVVNGEFIPAIPGKYALVWGDDGAECSDYSVFPCLVAAAEQVYGHNDCKTAFFALTGISLEDFIKIDLANIIVPQDVDDAEMHNKTRLYNDLVLGLYDGYIKKGENEVFAEHANQLAKVEAVAGKFSYLFTAQRLLCETLSLKNELGVQTRNFYKKQNKAELEKLLNKRYLPLKQKLSEFSEAFYNQWLRENKPFGLEIQNYRIGGLKERISYCINVLQAYIDGSIEKIEELEESILPLAGYGVNRDFRGIISANKL